VSITGLKGTTYLDQVAKFTENGGGDGAVYLEWGGLPGLKAHRLLDPAGAQGNREAGLGFNLVWNPWINKSQQMPDFGTGIHQDGVY
jgi:hypothetical protein